MAKQEEMGFLHQGGEETKKTQRLDGSVLLDMESLSLLVDSSISTVNTTQDAGAAASPRAPVIMQKGLTRKFSQRGERKAAADGDGLLLSTIAGVGRGGAPPPATAASPPTAVASDKFVAVVLSPAAASGATATAAAAVSPRQATSCRRAHGRRAAAATPWLDPRRVLLFFATLSSMGTIILLYFTLAVGMMGDGGDANARR